MSHRACMIDMETLSLDMDATICSIAAVITDLDEPQFSIKGCFSEIIDWEKGQERRSIDRGTIAFWLTQKREAQNELISSGRMQLEPTLVDFNLWIKTMNIQSFWSKGSDFDLKILETYYKKHPIGVPWNYRQVNCFRTITNVFLGDKFKPSEVEKHTAMGDAKYQAEHLYNIWQAHALSIPSHVTM